MYQVNRHCVIIINVCIYSVHYIDYRITIVIMYMHCIYLSDQLLVLAYIRCLILVIGISAKSCIGAPLVKGYLYTKIIKFTCVVIRVMAKNKS